MGLKSHQGGLSGLCIIRFRPRPIKLAVMITRLVRCDATERTTFGSKVLFGKGQGMSKRLWELTVNVVALTICRRKVSALVDPKVLL